MFERILQVFSITSGSRPALPIDVELLSLLEQMAAEEGRSVEDVIGDLLWNAVTERYAAVENLRPWEQLTPREKETTALACLGYTNHEIANLMVISTNTVKTHMRHVLRKFNVKSKTELREALVGWDFDNWIEDQNLWPSDASDGASSVGISP